MFGALLLLVFGLPLLILLMTLVATLPPSLLWFGSISLTVIVLAAAGDIAVSIVKAFMAALRSAQSRRD